MVTEMVVAMVVVTEMVVVMIIVSIVIERAQRPIHNGPVASSHGGGLTLKTRTEG